MRKKQVQHTPFRPARKDLAEAVFLAQWQALNEANPTLLADILRRNRCDVRSARVAASFIVWIGSNAGASFIAQAKARIEDFTYPEPAYLATWALVNRRQPHVNSGVRAIEIILSPDNLFGTPSAHFHAQKRAALLPISLTDIDVVESLVVWLSTAHADAFVRACEEQHRALCAHRLLVSHSEEGLG